MTDDDSTARQLLLANADHAVQQLWQHLTALEQAGGRPPDDDVSAALRHVVDDAARVLELMRAVDGSVDSPSTGEPTEPSAHDAPGDEAPADSRPRRDVAVVIATPPGVRPGIDAPPLGRLLVERRATRPQDVTLAVMQQGEGDDRPLGEILVDHGATTAAHVVEALERQAERSAAATSVRVDIVVLKGLARLVGELAETRDDVVSTLAGTNDATTAAPLQRLDRVCAELQDGIRKAFPPG